MTKRSFSRPPREESRLRSHRTDCHQHDSQWRSVTCRETREIESQFGEFLGIRDYKRKKKLSESESQEHFTQTPLISFEHRKKSTSCADMFPEMSEAARHSAQTLLWPFLVVKRQAGQIGQTTSILFDCLPSQRRNILESTRRHGRI